jgi:hypothetical protein
MMTLDITNLSLILEKTVKVVFILVDGKMKIEYHKTLIWTGDKESGILLVR